MCRLGSDKIGIDLYVAAVRKQPRSAGLYTLLLDPVVAILFAPHGPVETASAAPQRHEKFLRQLRDHTRRLTKAVLELGARDPGARMTHLSL